MVVVEGDLERITYFNEQTHYTIARLKTAASVRPVTLVGFLGGVRPGETLKVSGLWETHPRYGQQLRVKNFEVRLPASVQGVKKYLQSGVVNGLGPYLADRLVDHFGCDALKVIEETPGRLAEVEGIGKAKAAAIVAAWNEHHVLRALMRFLQETGVKTTYGAKIFHVYGSRCLDVLKESPYRLAEDIPDVGFEIADAVAKKTGTPADDPVRIDACVIDCLERFCSDGHTFAFRDNLVARCEHSYKVSPGKIEEGIDRLADSGDVILEGISPERSGLDFEGEEPSDRTAVYRKAMHRAESGIASRLAALLSVPPGPENMDAKSIHFNIVNELSIDLSPGQLEVLEGIFSEKAAIITGGPGTGKTTLIRSIAAVFKAMGKKVALGAPTGRAARRLAEASGEKAFTVHRLLGYTFAEGGPDKAFFGRDRDNPIEADVIIIDEASMVDTVLMYRLLNAVSPFSRLVLVGDVFQLPSVGPGNVLADMIRSDAVRVYELKKIFRQALQSPIVLNAHKVRQGEYPDLTPFDGDDIGSEFYFLEQEDPKKIGETVVDLCTSVLPERFSLNPVTDIQVLTPMHKGEAGTINLNQLLQSRINQSPVKIDAFHNAIKPGDKVMHLKNNYQKEVFNGDIGIVGSVDVLKRKLYVDYEGREVEYDYAETDELSLAYAISVHKSQGSEYPAVVLPLVTQHYVLLQRNLLYTAITRGIRLVIVVGMRRALEIALGTDKPQRRLSGLSFRIKEFCERF